MNEEFLKAQNKISVIEAAVVAVLSFGIVFYAPFLMGFIRKLLSFNSPDGQTLFWQCDYDIIWNKF